MKKENSVQSFFSMTFGCILLSLGIYFFKIPNGFATGGVTGIGTILAKITPISPSTWIWFLNILLLFVGFLFLGKQCTVVGKGIAADLGELIQQCLDGEFFLFLTADVEDDFALVHHDQTVAVGNCIAHVVGYHHGHQVVFLDDLFRQGEYLFGSAGIQRGSMLVQQKQLGLFERSH